METGMRYVKLTLVAAIVAFAAACTPAENQGGTPLPSTRSEAPLNDEAIGPSDEPAEIGD
jgi:hypothetical protein